MTDELQPEDRAILEAVDRLNGEGSGDAAAAPEPLVREYTEILALLPYELEPVAPRPELKQAILSQIAGPQKGVEDLTLVQGGRRPRRDKAASEVTLVKLPERGKAAPAPAGGGFGFRRALLPLAATLAIALVGLGYLFGRVQEQQRQIARLESALTQAQDLAESLGKEFQMVATIARTAYPLRPMEPETGEKCSGTVFVCGQHQQWLLSVRDLPPAPSGREYHLWFVTQEGMVDAGTVEIREHRGNLQAPTMPVGTRGFALSLEEPGQRGKPAGQIVLVGDRPVTL